MSLDLWSFITAISTSGLFAVAWIQLGKSNKIASAEFLHKLKLDFFVEETQQLFILIDNDLLKFIDGRLPKFRVIKNGKYKEVASSWKTKKDFYAPYEIDDLVLGHFEDLGSLERSGIVDIQMVYDSFSWYIETAWKTHAIKDYLIWHERPENDETDMTDVYENYKYIYWRCLKYAIEKKQKKRNLECLQKAWPSFFVSR